MDGSALRIPGRARFGAIIKNEDGAWIYGFTSHLGISTNVHAEITTLMKRLETAWSMGIRNVSYE